MYLSAVECGYAHAMGDEYLAGVFSADVPRWRQLADLIISRIESGEYQPRQPIPSEHALVQETGLSRSTVQKAIRALRDEGRVYSVHGLGTFVRPPSSPAR